MKIRTAGGRYDPAEPTIYFVAGNNLEDVVEIARWNLAAVNDVAGDGDGEVSEARTRELRARLDADNIVLLDSGIFWLTQRHRARHPGMSMNDALGLPPDEVDGFDWLWRNYLLLTRQFEDELWGYIELDQGGADAKRATRTKLEALGLRPIPVYHPLNDGWDYFDELCERYDRICFGNIVHANAHTRKHLLATLWERRRRYPDVWVHVLGMTMSEIVTVYPVSSCDSSSWVYAVRYGAQSAPGASAMGDSFSRFPSTFSYDQALGRLDAGGLVQGLRFLSSEARFMQAGMRRQADDLADVFGSSAALPPADERERVRT